MAGAKRDPEKFADRKLVHYYASTAQAGPSRLVLRALEHAGGSSAVDIGCGIGRDTLVLSRRGYRVLAIDHAPGAILVLRRLRLPGVTPRLGDFRRARLPAGAFDLVHASLALPLAGPTALPRLVGRLARSLRPRGVLSFHLFGPRHPLNRPGADIAFHTRRDAVALVAATGRLEILELRERRPRPPSGLHLFEVIARSSVRQ